jgi:hypothetical protein
MEVGQGPNWGCSAKEKIVLLSYEVHLKVDKNNSKS